MSQLFLCHCIKNKNKKNKKMIIKNNKIYIILIDFFHIFLIYCARYIHI
jgi:predicted AAA+ superfamily ATPase